MMFSENLVAVFSRQAEVNMNKPIAVGNAILEIAKHCMYYSYYNEIIPLLGRENVDLLTTDTDSFLLWVLGNSVDSIFSKLKPIMDFSNYDEHHHLHSNAVKGKLGLFKDEMRGRALITASVCVRSKCYCLKLRHKKLCEECLSKMTESERESAIEKHASYLTSNRVMNRCKGTPRYTVKQLRYRDFEKVISGEGKIVGNIAKIASKEHVVSTIKQTRLFFSAMDDKRYYLCKIHSIPYGHHRIPQYELDSVCFKCV
jgi:hypothetical protein